jgi:chromate transport protein ChrA
MANDEPLEKPLSTGEWFVTLVVLAIPVIGLIMHFVWAFGGGTNLGRRNFCRAFLLMVAVLFCLGVLTLVGFLLLGGTMAALLNNAHR